MERPKDGWGEFNLFPRLRRCGQFLASLTRQMPYSVPDSQSDHYRASQCPDFVEDDYRGGASAIDRALYDGPNQMTFFEDDE